MYQLIAAALPYAGRVPAVASLATSCMMCVVDLMTTVPSSLQLDVDMVLQHLVSMHLRPCLFTAGVS